MNFGSQLVKDHSDYRSLDENKDVLNVDPIARVVHKANRPGLPLNSNWVRSLPDLLEASCTRSGADFTHKKITEEDEKASRSILDQPIAGALTAQTTRDAGVADPSIQLGKIVRKKQLPLAKHAATRSARLRRRLNYLRRLQPEWENVATEALHQFAPGETHPRKTQRQEYDPELRELNSSPKEEDVLEWIAVEKQWVGKSTVEKSQRAGYNRVKACIAVLQGSIRSIKRELKWRRCAQRCASTQRSK